MKQSWSWILEGQYTQLIARCVREAGVFTEIIPYNASLDRICGEHVKGIIFSGGPDSVYAEDRSTVTLGCWNAASRFWEFVMECRS